MRHREILRCAQNDIILRFSLLEGDVFGAYSHSMVALGFGDMS